MPPVFPAILARWVTACHTRREISSPSLGTTSVTSCRLTCTWSSWSSTGCIGVTRWHSRMPSGGLRRRRRRSSIGVGNCRSRLAQLILHIGKTNGIFVLVSIRTRERYQAPFLQRGVDRGHADGLHGGGKLLQTQFAQCGHGRHSDGQLDTPEAAEGLTDRGHTPGFPRLVQFVF